MFSEWCPKTSHFGQSDIFCVASKQASVYQTECGIFYSPPPSPGASQFGELPHYSVLVVVVVFIHL